MKWIPANIRQIIAAAVITNIAVNCYSFNKGPNFVTANTVNELSLNTFSLVHTILPQNISSSNDDSDFYSTVFRFEPRVSHRLPWNRSLVSQPSFQASAAMLMRSALFWGVTLTDYQPPRTPSPTHSTLRLVGFLFLLDSWPLKMGSICCPETSVDNYHTTPRNIPEKRRSQVFGGSLRRPKQMPGDLLKT
jgi:hypothetical protein